MQTQCWTSCSPQGTQRFGFDPLETIERMASANAVVIFSMSTCCMCHAAKRLFLSMGVSVTVYEIDEHALENEFANDLATMLGGNSGIVVPVVFIGGKLIGTMDRVMAAHINGKLVPLLKEAGALWL